MMEVINMNISRKIRFIILYGLPARGKTTYAKSIENKVAFENKKVDEVVSNLIVAANDGGFVKADAKIDIKICFLLFNVCAAVIAAIIPAAPAPRTIISACLIVSSKFYPSY